jgi:inosine/xanthosine triphosphatase
MRVAVGSLNPAKIEAVRQAFALVWPENAWEVQGTDVVSAVSAQPMSDAESIRGARHRATRALAQSEAEYGVGLEGGLHEMDGKFFDGGWIVVRHRNGQEGVGCSVRMPVHEEVMRHVHAGRELGEAIDLVYNVENAKQKQGHFGLMTDNLITRTSGYRDAVIVALSVFRNLKEKQAKKPMSSAAQ